MEPHIRLPAPLLPQGYLPPTRAGTWGKAAKSSQLRSHDEATVLFPSQIHKAGLERLPTFPRVWESERKNLAASPEGLETNHKLPRSIPSAGSLLLGLGPESPLPFPLSARRPLGWKVSRPSVHTEDSQALPSPSTVAAGPLHGTPPRAQQALSSPHDQAPSALQRHPVTQLLRQDALVGCRGSPPPQAEITPPGSLARGLSPGCRGLLPARQTPEAVLTKCQRLGGLKHQKRILGSSPSPPS